MDEPTTHDPEPGPMSGSTSPTTRAPRWLVVTAIAASITALAALAIVARGGLGDHRVDHSVLAIEQRVGAGAAGPNAGSGVPHARLDAVRDRVAERRAERRELRHERRDARREAALTTLAEELDVEVAELAAAIEVGRAAGRDAARETVAEELGIELADLEAALSALGRGRGGSL